MLQNYQEDSYHQAALEQFKMSTLKTLLNTRPSLVQLKRSLCQSSKCKSNNGSFPWTQFGSNLHRENEEEDVQLYSERRLLGYSKEQVCNPLAAKFLRRIKQKCSHMLNMM